MSTTKQIFEHLTAADTQ